jgi:hypothetical protein
MWLILEIIIVSFLSYAVQRVILRLYCLFAILFVIEVAVC